MFGIETMVGNPSSVVALDGETEHIFGDIFNVGDRIISSSIDKGIVVVVSTILTAVSKTCIIAEAGGICTVLSALSSTSIMKGASIVTGVVGISTELTAVSTVCIFTGVTGVVGTKVV